MISEGRLNTTAAQDVKLRSAYSSSQILNASKYAVPTTPLCPVSVLDYLMIKKKIIPHIYLCLEFLVFNPLSFVLLWTSRKSQISSSLHHPIGWTVPAHLASPHMAGASSPPSPLWSFSGLALACPCLLYWAAHLWTQHSRCASPELSRETGSAPSTCWQCSPRGSWLSLLWGCITGSWSICLPERPGSFLQSLFLSSVSSSCPAVFVESGWDSGHKVRRRATQMSSFVSHYSVCTPIGSSWGKNTLGVGDLCIALYWFLQTCSVLPSETARKEYQSD